MNEHQNKINELVSSITTSYKQEEYIIPQDLGPLPNRDDIIKIAKLLRQFLFPGYFSKKNFDEEVNEYHVGNSLMYIFDQLSEQVTFALKHQNKKSESYNDSCINEVANKITYKFLEKIPMIREYISTDVQAAFDGDPSAGSKEEIIFSFPGIFAISIYRLAHELFLLSVPLIPRILSEYAHNITGIDIHPGATIGKYFFIDHGTGVVVGETTIIGNNVKIYQGVTLGALSTRGGQKLNGVRRHPTIEEDVTVYSGASILGGETVIGSSSVIGSNAFITASVPSGTKVSIKNPELLFKDGGHSELNQEYVQDWII